MNLHKVDLNLLIVFDTVFRIRNITHAGDELHLTQSAVSNALKRLRAIVGDHLFLRSPRGMIPTQAAHNLADPVREILAQIQTALDKARPFDPSTSKQRFRVFLSDVAQLVFLPKLLASLAREAPTCTFETVATSPTEGCELMESGDIDLAIGHFEGFRGQIFQQHLFDEEYICVVRKNHPSIGTRLTLKQFLNCRHLVYRPTAGSHAFFEDSVEQFFLNLGRSRQVAVRVSHGLGLGQIIRKTDLLASLPSRLASELARTENLRTMRLPIESSKFEICQYWHRRVQHDGANLWLRSLITRLFCQIN